MPAEALNLKQLVWLKYRFIGDAVMATPLMRSVYGSGPDHMTVFASKHLVELFGSEPYAKTIEPTGQIKGAGPFFREIRDLRARRFDRVFLVNRSIRSALIARFASIPERVGHTTEGRGSLLTHKVPYDVVKFEASCYGDLCRAVGIACDDSRVFLTADNPEKRYGTIGIHPGSTALHKAVRPEHWKVLVDRARADGMKMVLLGGKDEQPYGDRLIECVGGEGIESYIGKCSLSETKNLIASLDQIFCGDTGLVHIGAGVDTPTVSVFAATPASKWGHHYAPHQVIDVQDLLIEKLDPNRLVAALEARC